MTSTRRTLLSPKSPQIAHDQDFCVVATGKGFVLPEFFA